MADQNLEILIKTVADLRDGDLTLRQQKELQSAIAAVGASAELSMRQLRALEQAAAKVRGRATGISAEQAAAGRVEQLQRPADVRPNAQLKTTPTPSPQEDEEKAKGGHNQYNMRRHFGAMAGQVLGMPGMGMMVAAGGAAAGIGVATLAIEKLVGALDEYVARISEIEREAQAFDTVGQRIETLSVLTKELTHHNALFAASYSHISEQFNTAMANLGRLNSLTQVQIGLEDKLLDLSLKRNKAQIDANPGMPEFEKTRRKLELDEAFTRKQEENEVTREKRKVAAMVKAGDDALERERRARADKAQAEGEIPELKRRAQIDAAKEGLITTEADEKLKLLNEARRLLGHFAEGTGGVGDNISLVNTQSKLRDYDIDLGIPKDISKRTKATEIAEEAIGKIGDESSGLIGQQVAAKTGATTTAQNSANRLKLAEERVAHTEKLINENKTAFEQLKADANAKAVEIEELKRSIQEMRGPRGEAKDFEIQRSFQNGIPPMPRANGGLGMTEQQGQDILKELRALNRTFAA